MGIISYQTYLAESEREGSARNTNFNGQSGNRQSVGFFSLKNDKDSAIVRFMVDDINELPIIRLHNVKVGAKSRKISCARDPHEPIEKCPFCAAQKQLSSKIFVPLIEYVREEDGSIKGYPKIWEKSAGYGSRIVNLLEDYGPLSECLFKITRNGAAGDTNTTYSENYCKPQVYPDEIYKKDENAFNDFHVMGRFVLELSLEEAEQVLNGEVPERLAPRTTSNSGATTTPASHEATASGRAYSTPSTSKPAYVEKGEEYVATPKEATSPAREYAPTSAPAHSTRTTGDAEATPTRPRRYYA